ncbi:MAG: hypothetical protein WCO26_17685 [Deltaproteobacteria bacterium]
MARDDPSERYRWVILAIVYLSILNFALLFQSIPPILPFIAAEFRLTCRNMNDPLPLLMEFS